MEILQQDLAGQIINLIPIISLILTLIISIIILNLYRRSRHEESVPNADHRIATLYRESEFHAAELIKDATEKAKRIIQEAAITRDTLDSRLESALAGMNDSLQEKIKANEDQIFVQFKKVFDTIAQSYQNEGSRIIDRFKDEGDTMLKTYIQTMHAEINSVREQLFQNLDAKMSIVEEDLQKYREEQKNRINQNLKKLTKSSMEAYMRESLSYENHENILFKVLEKFSKDTDNNSQKA